MLINRKYYFLILIMVILFGAASITPAWTAQKPVDLSTAIIQVAKQNLSKVVYIEVTESREVTNPMLPFQNDPFFRHFFGAPKMPKKFKQETKGLGSGIIIDSKGHILTNYHVAGGATKIEVTLADGSKYPARLVGGDPKTDLAVIHISAKESLPFVTFGDSDQIRGRRMGGGHRRSPGLGEIGDPGNYQRQTSDVEYRIRPVMRTFSKPMPPSTRATVVDPFSIYTVRSSG